MSTGTAVATEEPATSSVRSISTENQQQSRPAVSTPTKTTKRKFDDALLSLDEALRPLGEYESPSGQVAISSKRTRLTKSIYSTLAKYGINTSPTKSKTAIDNDVLKTTPHLAAILARTASRTRKAIPFKIPTNPFSKDSPSQSPSSLSPVVTEYRPSSTPSFLSRLSTFKLSSYSTKPTAIDGVAASKCGWTNEGGKDRLYCSICKITWVVVGRDGLSRDAANTLVDKQRGQLISMHKDGCPWKSRQCDPDIYRIPLKSPAALAKEVKLCALQMTAILEGVELKHPLTSSYLQSLISTIFSLRLFHPQPSNMECGPLAEDTQESETSNIDTRQPSETAVLVALFGWSLVPPSPPKGTIKPALHTSSPSNNTENVRRPSTPSTPTPTSRVRLPSLTREATPGVDSRVSPMKETDSNVLHCILCQRRVGLWAFYDTQIPIGRAKTSASNQASTNTAAVTGSHRARPQTKRQFDLLKEHRSYCPYIVRSTMVPSLPTTLYRSRSISQPSNTISNSLPAHSQGNGDLMEGWRAVLMIVLRHGLRQKQRQRALSLRLARDVEAAASGPAASNVSSQEAENQDADGQNELDDIQAMVDDVKSHGGKDLLKYVRSLLT